MVKERNSNIELLRIISITMIVISHYCTHGIGNEIISNLNFSINRFLLEFLTWGNFGSILFVLISGYYLINSNKIKIKKLLKLIFQIFFYSILIYIMLVLLKQQPFLIKDLIKNVFPLSFKLYWFATAYTILYLFHPYINKLLNNLTKKEHLIFIILMFIVFSILHTLTTSDYYGNEIIQFIMFYSIGAYLFKYNFSNKNNTKIIILSLLLIILSIICIDLLVTHIPKFYKYSSYYNSIYFLSRTSPFAILSCVSLFKYFINLKPKTNSFINLIGSLIFGVYLISDNLYLRSIIWNNIFNSKSFVNSPYLILHIISCIILIIIACLFIELFRKEIIEKKLFKLLDNKLDNLQVNIEKFANKKIKKLL